MRLPGNELNKLLIEESNAMTKIFHLGNSRSFLVIYPVQSKIQTKGHEKVQIEIGKNKTAMIYS